MINEAICRQILHWYGEWNFHYGKWKLREFQDGSKTIHELSIITGGWNDNEEIIYRMQNNLFFWNYWESSHRGGMYVFHLRKEIAEYVGALEEIGKYEMN